MPSRSKEDLTDFEECRALGLIPEAFPEVTASILLMIAALLIVLAALLVAAFTREGVKLARLFLSIVLEREVEFKFTRGMFVLEEVMLDALTFVVEVFRALKVSFAL